MECLFYKLVPPQKKTTYQSFLYNFESIHKYVPFIIKSTKEPVYIFFNSREQVIK